MYLNRCPHYLPYLAKYLFGKNQKEIWKKMRENIITSLATVKAIKVSRGLVKCKKLKQINDLQRLRNEIEIMAKFWNYAVMYHDNKVDFLDLYFSKIKSWFSTTKGRILMEKVYKFL